MPREPSRFSARTSPMLYMVIERFKAGNPTAVGQRFKAKGRLMPEGSGVAYVASWMAADGSCCYQLMDSPGLIELAPWIAAWSDLVEFEVIPVQSSADFWAARG
ncbi:MAG: DUF3303 family protein [Planctomycetota bacterium]